MPDGMANHVLAEVSAPAVGPAVAAPSDRDLLDAFRQRNDEAAFEALVQRHGPLVMGVCRRSLGNDHDAADAFQAVFLVLTRKAAGIRTDVLGAWLHSVAVRTSLKARAVREKRLVREQQVIAMPEPVLELADRSDEALAVLDEEVRALPEKYRLPVILCELQGRSRKDAAETLKLPEGTLSSRLATARTKLAERLRGRGVALSATALATLLAQSAAQASVPAALVTGTVKTAVLVNAGQAATAVASAEVAGLTQGVITSMWVAKIKVVCAMLIASCLLSVGLVATTGFFPGDGVPDEKTALAALQKLGAKLTWAVRPVGGEVGGPAVMVPPVQAPLAPPLEKEPKITVVPTAPKAAPKAAPASGGVGGPGSGIPPGLAPAPLPAPGFGGPAPAAGGPPPQGGAAVPPPPVVVFPVEDGKGEIAITPIAPQPVPRGTKARPGPTMAVPPAAPQPAPAEGVRLVPGGGVGPGQAAPSFVIDGAKEGDQAIRLAPAPMAYAKILIGIDLDSKNVTDEDLKYLAPFKQLQTLVLKRTKVTDAGMKKVGAIRSLQSLDLGFNGLTDDGMKDLAGLAQLRNLRLDKAPITDAGLKSLEPLAQLTSLTLEGTNVADGGMKSLAAFPKIMALNLSRTKVTDAGLKDVAALPRLAWLSLDDDAITDAGLKVVAASKTLDSLWICGTKIADAGLAFLAPLPKLRVLMVERIDLTDAAAPHLVALTKLDQLSLRKTKFTDVGVKELVSLQNLRWLSFDQTAVSDVGLKDVAKLRQLTYLSIHETKVTNAGMKELTALSKLDTLHVSWTKVTAEGLKDLLPVQSIQVLWLGGLEISDEALKVIAGFKKLHTLWLDFTKVTDDGLKELTALANLKELRLNNTGVSDDGMKTLSVLPKLNQVIVHDTAVTEAGTRSLQQARAARAAPINVIDVVPPTVFSANEEPRRSGMLWWVAGSLVLLAGVGLIGWLQPWRRKPNEVVKSQSASAAAGAGHITVRCTGCERNLKVKAELAGRKGKCPQCGQVVAIPVGANVERTSVTAASPRST
jgi:internalin A